LFNLRLLPTYIINIHSSTSRASTQHIDYRDYRQITYSNSGKAEEAAAPLLEGEVRISHPGAGVIHVAPSRYSTIHVNYSAYSEGAAQPRAPSETTNREYSSDAADGDGPGIPVAATSLGSAVPAHSSYTPWNIIFSAGVKDNQATWAAARALPDTGSKENWIRPDIIERAGLVERLEVVVDHTVSYVDFHGTKYGPTHSIELTWFTNSAYRLG
jgi:hypothetical protein